MKNITIQQAVSRLKNSTSFVKSLTELNQTADKARINDYKAGDIIACFAGHPREVICIVELTTDKVDVDNIENCISGQSLMPLTSHLIQASWFKIG